MHRSLAFLGLLLSSTALADLRVAVVPFDNGGGAALEGLGVGLQSMVTTDLSQADEVTVVERARIQDLLAEMKLAKDGVVDPKTAVELGKVAGATHVVAGSYTVMGDKMRLDARLANVQTGEVTVAEDISGEKDAFFELEKELVKKLLASMGAELSPKERAAVGRLHTADFDSFTRFGQGIALFDADRYDEAVAILEGVAQSDADFTLAAMTLADIKAVQEQAEKKARAARVAAAEEAFVVHQESAQRQADILARLQKDGTDPNRSWQERATANLLLVTAAGTVRTNGGLYTLRQVADIFALRRMGERAWQAYWAELRERPPEFYPIYRDWWTNLDMEKYTYEEHFEHNLSRFFTGTNPNYLVSSCRGGGYGTEQMSWLWVPRARQLELQAALLRDMRGCIGDEGYFGKLLDVAEAMEAEGRVAASTTLLKEISDSSQDERLLTKVATQAKENAERKEALDAFAVGTPEHELVLFGRQRVDDVKRAQADGDVLSDVSYYVRAKFDPVWGPLFLSGVPVWPATRLDRWLITGPRTGRDETASVRHYDEPHKGVPPGSNLLLTGVPRRDGTVRVTLDFRPAKDWWPMQRRGASPDAIASWKPVDSRPTAGIVLAVREVETDPICDPVDKTKMTPVPTTGFGVLVQDGELVLAELEETFDEPDRCNASPNDFNRFRVKTVLASKALSGDRFELVATVKGKRLVASAGKVKLEATLPDERSGFPGLYAEGAGYVELSAFALESGG
ncbi:MAG: hypothetical protein H6737_04320 [Alphaproteobacteria bacterium]|nr:hypothetical protein [Alphaproteobacteria bacterium]